MGPGPKQLERPIWSALTTAHASFALGNDLHKLELADGTKAFDLLAEPAVLFRKLTAMKIPQIEVTMGSIDLMLALARHRAATKIDKITGKPAA